MKKIKVSVIIPTYKRSEDICRAVDSVLNQTIDSYEVIVVDDNGKGTEHGIKTENMMKKYDKNKNVIYIQHEKNKNGSAARNTGIRIAKGKYIAFLDDDDAFLPERLKTMYEKMEQLSEEWGACYTGYIKHMQNQTKQLSAEKVEGDIFLQTLMRAFYLGSGSNLFFRRTVIDDIGFFNEKYKRNQDLEYLIRVSKKYKLAYVDQNLLEIFYDIRTTNLNIDELEKKETLFRENFSPYLNDLPEKNQKEVIIMYNLDWIRTLISNRLWVRTIKTIIKSQIPIYIYIRYIKYAIKRKKENTCYGFVVKLKK